MRNFLPSLHALRWAFAIVAIIAAAILGNLWGSFYEKRRVAVELAEYKQVLGTIDEEHKSEIARLSTERNIADASNRELQASFQQLEAELLEYRATQTLYERIEGVDVSTGLAIDSVSKGLNENGVVAELHITLIQARGRERVQGQIGVALRGENEGSNWREMVVDVESDSAPRFDMRFFQTLVVPIPSRDFPIDFVEISVEPEGKRHKPFNYEKDWADIKVD